MYKEFKDLLKETTISQKFLKEYGSFKTKTSTCQASMYPLTFEEYQKLKFKFGTKVSEVWLRDGFVNRAEPGLGTTLRIYNNDLLWDDPSFDYRVNSCHMLEDHCIYPAMHLYTNLKTCRGKSQIGKHKVEIFSEGDKHYIRLLSMRIPQTVVHKPSGLVKTKRSCLGRFIVSGDREFCEEKPIYEKDGCFYILYKACLPMSSRLNDSNRGPIWIDGIKINHGDEVCVEIKPVELEIMNWADLPKSINPNGTEEADEILGVARNSMGEFPFNTSEFRKNAITDDFAVSWLHDFLENKFQESIYFAEGVEKQLPQNATLKERKSFLLAKIKDLQEILSSLKLGYESERQVLEEELQEATDELAKLENETE